MVRGGPGSYRLRMNQSEIEAEIHTLRDGGLLMQARVYLFYTLFVYVVFMGGPLRLRPHLLSLRCLR